MNKIAEEVTKSNDDSTEKQETVDEMISPPKKKRRNIKQVMKTIIKVEQYKISKSFKD